MLRSEVQEKMLVWWKQPRDQKLLCRVVILAPNFIGLRIVAATPEQVLKTNYGVGELAYPMFQPEQFEKASA